MVAGARRGGTRVRFRLRAFVSSMGDNTTDRRVDAEWIMEKKDWRQQQQQKSVRQERTVASPEGGGCRSPTDSSGSSPLGGHDLGGDGNDYVAANAYLPEVDEMRCLLWAHGGSSVPLYHSCRPFLSPFVEPIHRWLFFRERGPGEVSGGSSMTCDSDPHQFVGI